MFEVQDLKFATLATVSRCGMVWFSEDVLSTDMIFDYYLQKLMCVPVEESEDDSWRRIGGGGDGKDDLMSPTLAVCLKLCSYLPQVHEFCYLSKLHTLKYL